MSIDTQGPPLESRYGFVIDHRIPLWGVLVSLASIVGVLMGMWFTMGKVQDEVANLKVTVKEGNSIASNLVGDQALLRLRIEHLESDVRELQSIPLFQAPALPRKKPDHANHR